MREKDGEVVLIVTFGRVCDRGGVQSAILREREGGVVLIVTFGCVCDRDGVQSAILSGRSRPAVGPKVCWWRSAGSAG